MTFIDLDGTSATDASVFVPERGVWAAELNFPIKHTPTGRLTLTIGSLEFEGTVDPDRSYTFQQKSRVCLLAGAGGWRTKIKEQPFHNDAGLKASTVANATATEVGETIESAPTDLLPGVDYIRRAEPAGRVLDRLYPSKKWRVDFDGITRIGEVAQSEVVGSYDLINFDVRNSVAEIATDNPALIKRGSILRGRLDEPMVVVALDMHVGAAFRLFAWLRRL